MYLLTNSELSDLRRCPRMYWLKYVQRLVPRDPPSSLKASEIGGRIHTALERYYTGTEADVVLQDVLYEIQQAAANGDTENEKSWTQVHAALEGYFEYLAETGVDQQVEFAEIEAVHQRELGDGYVMLMKADALTVRRDNRELELLDHKSTGYPLSVKLKELRNGTQRLHYAWVLSGVARIRTIRFNMLRQSMRTERSSGPFYDRQELPILQAEVDAYERHVREDWLPVLERLHGRPSAPAPTPDADCFWRCPFYSVCPSFDNGDDVADMLQEGYTTGDPLARYHLGGPNA